MNAPDENPYQSPQSDTRIEIVGREGCGGVIVILCIISAVSAGVYFLLKNVVKLELMADPLLAIAISLGAGAIITTVVGLCGQALFQNSIDRRRIRRWMNGK